MNGPIDIVVPFLFADKVNWQEEFNKYKYQEGFKMENRFRDWGAMKYWLRGVELNSSWINKVFIILFDEKQIPSWLNLNHPKLKIVFHRDYIPKEYIPTFNTVTIEMFIHNIPGLSENFIYCNDDMYFLKKLPKDTFFINNTPVSPLLLYTNKYRLPIHEWFDNIINNNIKCISEVLGSVYNCHHPHLFIPMNKTFMQFIWYKCEDKLLKSLSHSKFRNVHNIGFWIFDDIQRITNHAITNKNIFKNSLYFGNSTGDFSKCSNKDMFCFNDLDTQKNFEHVKACFLKFLRAKLPNKSSFEK